MTISKATTEMIVQRWIDDCEVSFWDIDREFNLSLGCSRSRVAWFLKEKFQEVSDDRQRRRKENHELQVNAAIRRLDGEQVAEVVFWTCPSCWREEGKEGDWCKLCGREFRRYERCVV